MQTMDNAYVMKLLFHSVENGKLLMGLELCSYSLDDEIRFYNRYGSLMGMSNMPIVRFLKLMTDFVTGYGYIHDRQIVHMDIKPENILMGADNNYKITDFGLSLNIRNNSRLLSSNRF